MRHGCPRNPLAPSRSTTAAARPTGAPGVFVAAGPGGAPGAAAAVGTALALLAILLGAAVATADDRPPPVPDDRRDAVEARIRDLFAQQNALSIYPLPQLEEDRMSELLDGEIVRFREKWVLPSGRNEEGEEETRERHRVLAFYLIPKPRDVVWVASTDPHFLGNDRLSEARLAIQDTTGVWYQLLDPPWPAKNRHWVIDVTLSTHVAAGTHGQVWEQMWGLTEGGEQIAMEATAAGRVPDVPLERAKKSRYLEENTGAWTIFSLDDELTLVAYQLTIVMGGWIPDRLTARFAMGALEQLMRTVEEAAGKVGEHYDADHEPIWGGNRRIIPPFRLTPSVRSATNHDPDDHANGKPDQEPDEKD